jgi:hypothetical protein
LSVVPRSMAHPRFGDRNAILPLSPLREWLHDGEA